MYFVHILLTSDALEVNSQIGKCQQNKDKQTVRTRTENIFISIFFRILRKSFKEAQHLSKEEIQ